MQICTSNTDPKMGEIISGLWEKLYQGGVNDAIKNKVNEYAIGLYSDYFIRPMQILLNKKGIINNKNRF